MRPFTAFIALLLPLGASADEITVTLVDQNISTSASSFAGGSSGCSDSGVASASCSSSGPFGGAGGTASVSGTGIAASAYGIGSTYTVNGSSSATLGGTVSITRGTGTGYLLFDVHSSGMGTGPSYYSTLSLNGQVPSQNGWEAMPFTFGQNIGYSLSARAVASDDSTASSNLTVSDIRVYGYDPIDCGGQSCTDLGYVDVTSLFAPNSVGTSVSGSINSVPEPGTIWIAALGFSAVFLTRRFKRA